MTLGTVWKMRLFFYRTSYTWASLHDVFGKRVSEIPYRDLTFKQKCFWWHDDMETFSTLLALSEGNLSVTSGSPSQKDSYEELQRCLVRLHKILNEKSSCRLFSWAAKMLMWWHYNLEHIIHYSDVIMSMMASQITSLTIVYSVVVQAQIKEDIKAPRQWPLCGEFTGHRWIPRTKGQ